MKDNDTKGFIDPLGIAVITICFAFGTFLAIKTKKVDAPYEEAVEQVLEGYGIDIDFSAHKKDEDEDVEQ